MKEQEIQKQIKDFLQELGYVVVKVNNVGIKGNKTFIPPSQKGISDLLCCAPGGKFLAIEVKKPGGKPSVDQLHFSSQVLKAGGMSILAYSLDDVIAFIKGTLYGKN